MRFFGRNRVPEGAVGALDPDEHVLAWAAVTGGGHVVATSHGLWIPAASATNGTFVSDLADERAVRDFRPRRIGWHLVSRASWQGGAIVLVEAVEQESLDGVVILADQRPRRLGLTEPGRVPKVVHERVTGSIRSRHHRDLAGGGAWFVQRKVPGRGRFVLQVRPDPGTDPAVVRQVAGDVAKQLP